MRRSKQAQDKPQENPYFHNTLLLLKRYRDVVWSVESSMLRTRINFEKEFGCNLEEFLELSYSAGAGLDLDGTRIEAQMQSIEKSRKMLHIIDRAIEIVRTKHKRGERYYWILYYAFLSEHEYDTVEEIVEQVCQKLQLESMSWKTFYKYRNQAIECLSNVLWGYTSRDCLDIVDHFMPGGEG